MRKRVVKGDIVRTCYLKGISTELLLGLKHRGLAITPKVAVADGTLGFWAAARKVFPEMREQRCRVHKAANVLNNLPKSVQPKAKSGLHDIWQAETTAKANGARRRTGKEEKLT